MTCRPEQGASGWSLWVVRRNRVLERQNTVLIQDDQQLTSPDQMRECEFLSMLALRLARDIPARSQARLRILPIEPLEDSLFSLRDLVIGRGNLQAWINREFYGAPSELAERPFYGLDAIERMAARYQQVLKIYESVNRQLQSDRKVPVGSAISAAAVVLPPASLLVARGIQNTPVTASIPSSTAFGTLIHRLLQEHYKFTHTKNCVMTEVNISGPCAGQVGNTLQPSAKYGGNPEIAVWAQALRKSQRGQVRPDIVDMTTREVWEIKPRSEVVIGLEELYGLYLGPVNTAIAAYNAGHSPGLRAYGPGSSWSPFGIYQVGATVVAWIHTELPGIIYYDLFRVSPFSIPHYAEERAPSRQNASSRRPLMSEPESSEWWTVIGGGALGGLILYAAFTNPATGVAALVFLAATE